MAMSSDPLSYNSHDDLVIRDVIQKQRRLYTLEELMTREAQAAGVKLTDPSDPDDPNLSKLDKHARKRGFKDAKNLRLVSQLCSNMFTKVSKQGETYLNDLHKAKNDTLLLDCRRFVYDNEYRPLTKRSVAKREVATIENKTKRKKLKTWHIVLIVFLVVAVICALLLLFRRWARGRRRHTMANKQDRLTAEEDNLRQTEDMYATADNVAKEEIKPTESYNPNVAAWAQPDALFDGIQYAGDGLWG